MRVVDLFMELPYISRVLRSIMRPLFSVADIDLEANTVYCRNFGIESFGDVKDRRASEQTFFLRVFRARVSLRLLKEGFDHPSLGGTFQSVRTSK